jgi:hypothetical protein
MLGRPVSGMPTVNDEASDVRWVTPGDLGGLDIHPTQWRQLRDWLDGSGPHVDLGRVGYLLANARRCSAVRNCSAWSRQYASGRGATVTLTDTGASQLLVP